jgi:hypothetical protein
VYTVRVCSEPPHALFLGVGTRGQTPPAGHNRPRRERASCVLVVFAIACHFLAFSASSWFCHARGLVAELLAPACD